MKERFEFLSKLFNNYLSVDFSCDTKIEVFNSISISKEGTIFVMKKIKKGLFEFKYIYS